MKQEDQITITVSVSTNRVGSRTEREITFDRLEWESMTEKERDEVCLDTMFEMIEWNYVES